MINIEVPASLSNVQNCYPDIYIADIYECNVHWRE